MSPAADQPVLVTGGAGFIGTNLVARLAGRGQRVLIYDNLSRPGVDRNLAWLEREFGSIVEVEIADVRDPVRLRRAVRRASRVYHLAAQVAVTTSLVDPLEDFEVNARGTLNLLDAIRTSEVPPPLLFTSTNKVYGALTDVRLAAANGRYLPVARSVRRRGGISRRGVSEDRPLDFYSPYGCSKGTADQYVRDHARIFGLPTVVFRMSCIYGPHQCGNEDQGWIAHFLLRAAARKAITIYGNGLQVRDALFVEDLVDAMELAQAQMRTLAGSAFNIGGGGDNAVSLLEVAEEIAKLTGAPPALTFGPWRPGDQRYYVSDCTRFSARTGWKPRVGVAEGIRRLHQALQTSAASPSARASRGQSVAGAVGDADRGLG